MDMSYGFRSAPSVPKATEAQRSKLSLVKLRHATHLTCIGLAVVIAAKPDVSKGQKEDEAVQLPLLTLLPPRTIQQKRDCDAIGCVIQVAPFVLKPHF